MEVESDQETRRKWTEKEDIGVTWRKGDIGDLVCARCIVCFSNLFRGTVADNDHDRLI